MSRDGIMIKSNIPLGSTQATYFKLSFVSVIWGGTFVAGRSISNEIPALLAASLRFAIASLSLTFILILFNRGFKKINFSQALTLIGLGFCGIYTYNICFFYGLHYIDASRASLIVASNPAMMAILSFLLYREKISLVKFIGITFCLLGAMIVIINKVPHTLVRSSNSWMGDALIFGCVLSWVIYSIFSKKIVKEIGALHTVTYSIYVGTLLLIITAYMNGQIVEIDIQKLSFNAIISLFYLGAIGSALAYILYYDGIQQIGATRAGVFIALNPLTAVVFGVILLKESFSLQIFMGGILVIIGIFLTNKNIDFIKIIKKSDSINIS